MKKFITIMLLIIFLRLPVYTASAEEVRYSQIVNDGVYLYMDSSLSLPWFILPVGYYVKVLSVSHSFAKVEYKGDSPLKPSAKGYVSIEYLNLTDSIPSTPYPNLVLTVNQTCLLYTDLDFTISETVTPTSTVEYYGFTERAGGERFVYGFVNTTSGDKYVGFVPITAVYDFIIPSLPIQDEKESEVISFESISPPEVSNALGDSLQLVIIIAVSLVAVSIVYVLFHPSVKKAKDEVITSVEFDDE